jgi:hypothetical protein
MSAPLPTATLSAPQQPTTFVDAPTTHPYWKDIETLYASGLTSGCSTSPLKFCPDQILEEKVRIFSHVHKPILHIKGPFSSVRRFMLVPAV